MAHRRAKLTPVLVWWLMTGWGFETDSRIIGGPFKTFGECNSAGMHLPWQYASVGWHCDQS